MNYNRAYLEAFGYELPPNVISTAELEARLEPVYRALHLPVGQLEMLTGITERRWWDHNYSLSQGATTAAHMALERANIAANNIDVLVYAGVCREQFEPATACKVAANLGINSDAVVYDISNACLGVLNGIVDVANRIELGQCRAGLVVSCETSREINEVMIHQMLEARGKSNTELMGLYKSSLATLTGGSGAIAVLVVDESLSKNGRRKLLGGASKNDPQHHNLCHWGLQSILPAFDRLMATDAGSLLRSGYQISMRHIVTPFMATDAGAVLKYGVDLGMKTWSAFLGKIGWGVDFMDKVICHQVGVGHREAILRSLGIPLEKEFSTFEYLGNIGTVSLPLTAALAEERDFLRQGDRVGFLGIGSGLNCLMLGLEW